MVDTTTTQHAERISVIIPSYNHGKFLPRAIGSVLNQHYPDTEIVVIDDGSCDDTAEVVKAFPMVRYFFQPNQGLSAARNAGIDRASGLYLVFLDADDWLEKDALQFNMDQLLRHPEAAFVSGGHIKVNPDGKILETVTADIQDDHYRHLLEGNYIGMHGTVMYRRWVFGHFRYDKSLPACEDYDLYLKISRDFPVVHHTQIIASYQIHGHNMSSDTSLMLRWVLAVLDRQKGLLRTESERTSLERGRQIWTAYYSSSPVKKKEQLNMRKQIKKYLPDVLRRMMFKGGLIKHYVPAHGHIRQGDFARVKPFSTQFGYDRGGPVDRYYIENFLERHADLVAGNILEIGDNDYTLRYGASKITKTDILHIDANNPNATIIGDLSNAPQIADNTYDCIILTQTLHLIYDFKEAIQTCYRILKPGGSLLMTVPGITHIDQGEWKENWLWAFTGSSVSRLLKPVFSERNVEVETYGNVFAAAAFLYGMGVNEVKKKDLDYHDPHYQVIIVAKAVKPIQ